MPSFSNTILATINHIILPGQIMTEESKAFDELAVPWPELPVQVHVLDFKGVNRVHRSFYVSAAKFKKQVEANNAKVISINLGSEILEQLKSDGVEATFGYMKNLNLASKPKVPDTPDEMRGWLIKYAVEAARAAMHTMFNTTVAADENYRETPKNFNASNFFKVAIMNGEGVRVRAVFRLFFERATLEALSQTVAQATRTSADEELLLSTATELLNIIYTTVKSRLNDDRGYDLPPAIPSLVDPSTLVTEKKAGRDASWVPLVTPLGAYYLQIELGV